MAEPIWRLNTGRFTISQREKHCWNSGFEKKLFAVQPAYQLSSDKMIIIIIIIIILTSNFSKINQGYGRLLPNSTRSYEMQTNPTVISGEQELSEVRQFPSSCSDTGCPTLQNLLNWRSIADAVRLYFRKSCRELEISNHMKAIWNKTRIGFGGLISCKIFINTLKLKLIDTIKIKQAGNEIIDADLGSPKDLTD